MKKPLLFLILFFSLFVWKGSAQFTQDSAYDPFVENGQTVATYTSNDNQTSATSNSPVALDYFEDFEGSNPDWTLSNGTQANKWVVGTATSSNSTRSLYISNDSGVTNSYAGTTSVTHAYRELQIPDVVDQIALSFDWKGYGESTFDYMRVWLVPITFMPIPGTQITPGAGRMQIGANFNQRDTWKAESFIFTGTQYQGQLLRLIFEWRNDGSGYNQPPAAVDNVVFQLLACKSPKDLTASTIQGSSQFELTWTPVGAETQWEIIVQPFGTGTPLPTVVGIIVNEPSHTFLANDNELYEFFVRAKCDANEVSLWSGPKQFLLFTPPNSAVLDVVGVTMLNDTIVVCSNQGTDVSFNASIQDIFATNAYQIESIDYVLPYPSIGGEVLGVTSDDLYSPIVELPFNFCFFGESYSKVKVGSNGVLVFGDENMNGEDVCPYAFDQQIPNIDFPIKNAVYGVYQDTYPTNMYGNINYQVLGAFPNRAFVVNFHELPHYSCGIYGEMQTSQIVIYELSNIIDVYIGNRTSCVSWNNGNGVVGLQNNTGTVAYTPTDRNTGNWSAQEEAWRFTPDAAPISDSLQWFIGDTMISDQENVTISLTPDQIADLEANGSYTVNLTAVLTFETCSVDNSPVVILKEIAVVFIDSYPSNQPVDLISCSATSVEYFDLTLNEAIMLEGVSNSSVYTVKYFNSQTAAVSGDLSMAITTPENYIGLDGEVIWVRITDVSDCSIASVHSFTLYYNTEIVECPIPTALIVSNLTSSTVDLSWIATGELFDIEWGEEGFTLGQGALVSGVTNPYTINGLNSGLSYSFYVREKCGCTMSNWSEPYNIVIPCTTIAPLPYLEHFESDTIPNLPFCTSSQSIGPGNNWQTANVTTNGFNGKVIRYTASPTNAANTWFYTQGMELEAGTTYVLSYEYGNNTTSATEKLKVSVGMSPINTAMTTLIADHPGINQASKQFHTVNFAPAITGVYYFGFNVYSDQNQSSLYLDNIIVTYAEGCVAEWIGVVNTEWDNPQNWCDNSVPTAGSNIFIISPNPAVINTDVSIASITLGSEASLTVNNSLEVGNITVDMGGTFIISNDANLLQTDVAINSGVIKVRRNSSLIKHLDYTMWSSPVLGQGLQTFSPLTLPERIYSYNALNESWSVVTGNFQQGKAYRFRAPNDFNTQAYIYSGEFEGEANNGNITQYFTDLGEHQAVGNPYPSNLHIQEFWDVNPATGTLYFWTNTNPWDEATETYIGNNWATFNGVGEVATAIDPADTDSEIPTEVIPVGQGFLIATQNNLNQVAFTNNMRTNQNGVFFRTTANKHRLWLNFSSTTQYFNQMLIGYVNGATQVEDFRFDSKMFDYSGSALYSLIDNNQEAYIIQGRSLPFDDFDVVPLGFRTTTAGTFTISLTKFDGVFTEGQDIFLKDNLTQTQHNLKDGDYSFVSNQGEFATRFEVVYRSSMDVTTPELDTAWVVYAKDKKFFIETQGIDLKQVVVYDMLGRLIYQSQAEGNTHSFTKTSANQVLVIKVMTTAGQELTKKVAN